MAEPFLLGRIGQRDFGLWFVGVQIMAYLSLTDLGVVVLLSRESSYALGRAGAVEKAVDLPLIIGQTASLLLWQIPLVALTSVVLGYWIAGEWGTLQGPLTVMMTGFVLLFPLRIFQAVLQGLQDLAFLARLQIYSGVVSFVITVMLVLAGWGLYGLAIAWVSAQAIPVASCWIRLRRRFPGVLPASLPKASWNVARRRLGEGFWVSVAKVAQVLLSGTDLLVIGDHGPECGSAVCLYR